MKKIITWESIAMQQAISLQMNHSTISQQSIFSTILRREELDSWNRKELYYQINKIWIAAGIVARECHKKHYNF